MEASNRVLNDSATGRRRRIFVGAVTLVVIVASLLTAYVALPRLALERGLAYDTYPDATALAFVGPRQIGKPVIGKDGVYSQDGWDIFYGGFLDRERRFAMVEAQLHQNRRNAPAIWAVVDSEESRIIGSLRVLCPLGRQIGMDNWTTAYFVGFAMSSSAGDMNALQVSCRVELPNWWPRRTTVGNSQGAVWRPIYLQFDTVSRRWVPYSSPELLQWNDHRFWDRLTREKTLSLDGTEDELVVQHRAVAPIDQATSASEVRVIHFERLARRNKATGEIVWETIVDKFPKPQQGDDPFEVMLPGFPLESGSTWCLIGQKLSVNRLPIVIKYWKLDLETGDLNEMFPPHPPANSDREIISDGQTLLLRDTTTQSLIAWTPDHGTQVIGDQTLSNSDSIGVLSRRRILCVDHASDGQVVIRIVALDGDELRQIFP